jgi:hypothetical protein
MPVIPATWEAKIGESCFVASSGGWRESKQDPISKNKPGVVVHTYNPSYVEGVARRISS